MQIDDDIFKELDSKLTWFENKIWFPLHIRVFAPLRTFYYNLMAFPKNLIRWFPILWTDKDFDYYYIARPLEMKLRAHAKCHLEHGNAEDSEKTGKEMLDTADALKRLYENEYDYDFSAPNQNARNALIEADLNILSTNMKKILTWWD